MSFWKSIFVQQTYHKVFVQLIVQIVLDCFYSIDSGSVLQVQVELPSSAATAAKEVKTN